MHSKALVFTTIALLVDALVLSACGVPPEGGGDDVDLDATFATYNAGLARGFVDYATARTQPVADAVSEIDADAVCLQEIWLAQDDMGNWTEEPIDAVKEASSEVFPHQYVEITEPEDDPDAMPACTEQESEPLRECVEMNCAGVAPDQLATCALQNCQMEFGNTSGACQACLGANLGKPIDDIIFACRGGSASFTSRGHNGLMLLSRHEFQKKEFKRFESTVAARVALHARINVPDFGETDLYCTHLAANLTDLTYPGMKFDSFQKEQAAQIRSLLQFIEETSTTAQIVILGDMNTGPSVGGLMAELPSNYRIFEPATLRNPYLEQASPACTFCGDNTLIMGDDNKAIDHILLEFGDQTEDLTFPLVERIFDQTREVETSEGTKQLHLSDHFGVRTTVRRP